MIHRDLKPGNIMVTDDGRVKVLDFGLAKTGTEAGEDVHTQMATAPLTGEDRILGTLAYTSPEQLGGQDLDARSDLFSLGVILYEMATGLATRDRGAPRAGADHRRHHAVAGSSRPYDRSATSNSELPMDRWGEPAFRVKQICSHQRRGNHAHPGGERGQQSN